MPMNDPKALIAEYHAIASALIDWFESQDISTGRAVSVMSYLTGIMAANAADSEAVAMDKLQMLSVVSKLVCHGAMRAKG